MATYKVVTSDRFKTDDTQAVLSALVTPLSITTMGPVVISDEGQFKRASIFYV